MTATRKPKPEPTPEPSSVCKVEGCPGRRVYTRGLCALHWCTRGDLADPAPRDPAPEAVSWAKVAGGLATD